MKDDLVFRLRKRAEIRRQIDTRKSVQNNEPDRIADLLEEAANSLDLGGYVLLCKSCGEDLGILFEEHPKVTSHEELTSITKEWVYVQRS